GEEEAIVRDGVAYLDRRLEPLLPMGGSERRGCPESRLAVFHCAHRDGERGVVGDPDSYRRLPVECVVIVTWGEVEVATFMMSPHVSSLSLSRMSAPRRCIVAGTGRGRLRESQRGSSRLRTCPIVRCVAGK